MILEKRPILLALVLHFLPALCDDDALTSKGTTVDMSAILDYDFELTENPGTIYESIYESTESHFASYGATTTFRGSIVESLTIDSQPVINDDMTTDQTTTTSNDVTSSSTIDTINPNCNPSWPINASVDAMEVVKLRTGENGINTTWIYLIWQPPCNVPENVSVIYYIERYDDAKNCFPNKTIEINETWYNATGLQPCTQYQFVVKILTEFWESNGVNLSVTTNNTITKIEDVICLDAQTVSTNTIQLTWQEPTMHVKCHPMISHYLIVLCDEKCNNITVPASCLSYVASNLKMCTEYHFTVKAVTPFVESTGVNKTARTASPKLSAPQSFHVTPGNFSLIVKWEPPEADTICLKHYHITTDSYKYSENITNTSVIISNLHACETYQVYISAVNKDDMEGEKIHKSNTTLPYKTNPPVATGISPGITSLTMFWSIQKEKNNHCLLSTITIKCNYTETKGKGYQPKNHVSSKEIKDSDSAPSVYINITVERLSPFTSYTCWAQTNANFNNTSSDLSDGVNVTTLEDVPSPPVEITIENITDSQFSLSWKEPDYLPGHLEEFEIVIEWKVQYPIPNWCREEQDKNYFKKLVNESVFKYNYSEAKAFTNYTVYMRAKTGEGWSNNSDLQSSSSSSGVPGPVSKFNSSSITIKESLNDANVLDTILTWGFPCSLNGELEFFNVTALGTRKGYLPHFIWKKSECMDYSQNDYMCSINLNELNAEYNYTFTIFAKVRNVDTFGEPVSQNVLYPAGIPPQPNKEYIKLITLDPSKVQKSTTTATILLPLFSNISGDIKFYAIMVAKKGYNNIQLNTRFDMKSKIWPNVFSWKEAMMKDFSITYQATESHWESYHNHIVKYTNEVKAIRYTIGDDIYCDEFSMNTIKPAYCNGPLKPDTWYHVRMRAFTDGGYADSNIFEIKTNAELNVALVIGAVFGILSMGMLVTMMLLVRRCSPHIVFRRFLHSDMPGSPVPAPFTRKKFISHCQQLVDNPGKLSNEFRLLQTLSIDLQMPTNTACLQANRKKNRYSDILPYDFSRVKLEVIDNDPNTDYINASFIKGYIGEDEYIACQGPKEETTYDFWRMVNQYNISIIVMLTQLIEKGKEKCHQYYPTIKESFRYENMMIRCTSELDFRTHTQRTLVLQQENKKRTITHLHFKDWPDHDVPEDFDAMINFCQIMRRNITSNKGFIVVHCSAGIGRTGTLIAIDILLQQIRDNKKLDVFGTVYRLRHHRINMVQRESQYAYIYNCIKQVLKNPYFLKTYKPPPIEPVYENTSKKTTNSDTNLVNNLEILKKHNSVSMESLESSFNLFSRSTLRSISNSDLRPCKSTGAINIKTHHITVGKSQTLDCIFKPLRDSSYKLNRENLIQESLPLLTCSERERGSDDVLGDSMQYAINNM